jgi:threonylcarbamoyladenosine tRNA methylthiotransferase MtaB
VKDEIVPVHERRKRNRMLTILSEKKKRAFYEPFSNSTRPVLWEHENKEGLMFGYTDNYLRVSAPYDEGAVGTIETIELGVLSSEMVFSGSRSLAAV